jgi:WD40 repeat protein
VNLNRYNHFIPAFAFCFWISVAHSNSVMSVSFSHDGSMVVSGGRDMKVVVWNVSDGSVRRSWTAHTDDVRRVVFTS